MHSLTIPRWRSIHSIVFDFDGVFTDNKVYTDQDGNETVVSDRADGLALDMLRRFAKQENWNVNYFILSTERNPVVSARASKLKIPCTQGVGDKLQFLNSYLEEIGKSPVGLMYVGNDLNDLPAIMLASMSVAPSDAHPLIRAQATLVLPQKGGNGFVRALIEQILQLDLMSTSQLLDLVVPH